MRYLRRIIPIPWQYSILSPGQLINILNRKRLALVKVIEKLNYFPHLLLGFDLLMLFHDFCESHLADPYHASPPSISNIGTFDIVVKLREACTICKPRGLTEFFKKKSILFFQVLLFYLHFVSQQVNTVSWTHQVIFVQRFNHSNDDIAKIEAGIPYFLERSQTSCLGLHQVNIINFSPKTRVQYLIFQTRKQSFYYQLIMNSPFLYLNQRKLTLSNDSQRYSEVSVNTNKKIAWRFFSAACLCKLYDLSSLPKLPNQKLGIYTTFIFIVTAFSIFKESENQIKLLTDLDEKYKDQYEEYTKKSGFQAIV